MERFSSRRPETSRRTAVEGADPVPSGSETALKHWELVTGETIETVALGKQLLAATGMMLVITITHALGLTAISKTLRLKDQRLKEMDFSCKSLVLTAGMALMLLLLHSVEIALFAVFYVAVGALQGSEEALYNSASAYATLGRTAEYFPENWRLIGAIEALIGFLMIGWSTAFIVSKANRLMPD